MSCCTPKNVNTTSTTAMIIQYRQLVKRVFNVTVISIHGTLQITFPLSDAAINEAPWQCASLQHDRLLQLINGVELPDVVNSLLHGPKWHIHPNLNPGCWRALSGSMQSTFSSRKYAVVFRAMCDSAPYL